MVTLNSAKKDIALNIGGGSQSYPNYYILGTGSGTILSSQTTLFTPTDIQEVTAKDTSNAYKVTFTGDWNSVEMSGIQLREFGLTGISGTGFTGSMWSKSSIPAAISFDGTNELRIEETLEVF